MPNFTETEIRDFWDSVAGAYESQNLKVINTHNQRFREALKYIELKTQKKILNIWSRTGGAISFLRKINGEFLLFNAELSPVMLRIAKRKYPEEFFLQSGLHRFPFKEGSFDYVLSLETLEHVPMPMEFLRECARVLKKGGRLIMSLPPARAEWHVAIYTLLFGGHGEGPHRFLPPSEVKEFIKNSGLKLLLHRPTVYLPVANKYLDRLNTFLEDRIRNKFLQELAIRHFYICQKG